MQIRRHRNVKFLVKKIEEKKNYLNFLPIFLLIPGIIPDDDDQSLI